MEIEQFRRLPRFKIFMPRIRYFFVCVKCTKEFRAWFWIIFFLPLTAISLCSNSELQLQAKWNIQHETKLKKRNLFLVRYCASQYAIQRGENGKCNYTWNAGTQSNKHYCCNRIFDADCRPKMWSNITYHGSNNSYAEYWNHEAKVPFQNVCNKRIS